jgi:hypothetical protein
MIKIKNLQTRYRSAGPGQANVRGGRLPNIVR